ncbi:DUF2249 domain-containing protein [Rhodoplanes serenus]|jgi:uncharacterized protein (DUF2249 family)|uniref:DUF2249 domain-containing protein n=1 Tax=Rhodoplanes serenus TaxID=200615 RepID=A0A327KEK6_9BRAD|nr:DUF2249 domain-containing protein [Rhodoplanes serenus]MTW18843.1 DUF2249 domain-containing protein [Rhodoplanes serenus]RAI36584.1 hypothetical protein CH340_02640 [Rhodoplanes serenus]VCU08969.1 hypothetical protein RHODGE_RHODGE_02147 [Rhodoplanes serenus]
MSTTTETEIDVRALPPGSCRNVIFRAIADLGDATALVVAAPHDPAPLREYLAVAHPDEFDWTYVEQGPDVWRVRISRVAG